MISARDSNALANVSGPEALRWKGRHVNSSRGANVEPMICQYGEVSLAAGYRMLPKFCCHSPLSKRCRYLAAQSGKIDQDKWLQVGRWEELVSGPRKAKSVSNSVLNGSWGLGTTDVYIGEVQYTSPEISGLEVDISQLAPFLLTNPDFSKTEVVKDYAHTIVAPAIDYWKHPIEVKKGA